MEAHKNKLKKIIEVCNKKIEAKGSNVGLLMEVAECWIATSVQQNLQPTSYLVQLIGYSQPLSYI